MADMCGGQGVRERSGARAKHDKRLIGPPANKGMCVSIVRMTPDYEMLA